MRILAQQPFGRFRWIVDRVAFCSQVLFLIPDLVVRVQPMYLIIAAHVAYCTTCSEFASHRDNARILRSVAEGLTGMRSRFFLASVSIMLAAGCGRVLGVDTDHDGLTDRQELLFGTDPSNPDSDNDGILDGADPTPLGEGPNLTLTASPAYDDSSRPGWRCIDLVAKLMQESEILFVDRLTFSVNTGELGPATRQPDGTYHATVCANDGSIVEVVVNYLLFSRTVSISFNGTIPQPGINTAPYPANAPLEETLKIFSVDARTVGLPGQSPLPFPEAYVLVTKDGEVVYSGTTGPQGSVEINQLGLRGPVDVTVGAEGYRFTTYYDLDASVVSVAMVALDPILPVDAPRVGRIEGRVIGFAGEGGLPAMPEDGDLFDSEKHPIPMAIVQLAIRNRPLSSMSMGSVLEPPADPADPFDLPTNLVLYQPRAGEAFSDHFVLENVPEGQYLVFALAGLARGVLDAIKDPYKLRVEPLALGIQRISVTGGQTTYLTTPILLDIDLRVDQDGDGKPDDDTVAISMGEPPVDPLTGHPLPNRLVMPVVDVGGEGFVFVAIDGTYNNSDQIDGPVHIRYPRDDNPTIRDLLGIPYLNRLAVGLAGRASYFGADPPGISTQVRPNVSGGDSVVFHKWLDLPQAVFPTPPIVGVSGAPGLDTLSKDPFSGRIEWRRVSNPRLPDVYVIRLNYMTAAPRNLILEAQDEFADGRGSLGGPESHVLWELFVPGARTAIELPVFPPDAEVRPVLRNLEPTTSPTDDTPEPPQHYADTTIEIELNAYLLGASGKTFDYNANFEYSDVNLSCDVVSQDSFVVGSSWQ